MNAIPAGALTVRGGRNGIRREQGAGGGHHDAGTSPGRRCRPCRRRGYTRNEPSKMTVSSNRIVPDENTRSR